MIFLSRILTGAPSLEPRLLLGLSLLLPFSILCGAIARANEDALQGAPTEAAARIASVHTEDEVLLERISAATGGSARVAYHPHTGRVRFVGTDPARAIPWGSAIAGGAEPEEAARAFLAAYGQLFGVSDPATELRAVLTRRGEGGRSFVRFRQILHGVPVLGGELIVETDPAGNVLSAQGEAVPELPSDIPPAFDAVAARRVALELTAKHHGVPEAALAVTDPELWFYNPILLGPGRNETRLVWRLEVTSTDIEPIRELILVDTATGSIALHFNQAEDSLNREIYDNANSRACGFTGCGVDRIEGGPPTGASDADACYDLIGSTYDFYRTVHGRDGIDGHGMKLLCVTRYCPARSSLPCPYPNAFWNGHLLVIGQGLVADDVVAHELTHGVTDNESNLFYYMQSGALNEAFSDIWGEWLDQSVPWGNDTSAVRWLIGEDLDGTGIRNMKDPPAAPFHDPDKMSSFWYYCGDDDNGGVHKNSGVGNKIAYLLTDGGAFNGFFVTALGRDKTAALFYDVQANRLTSGADYYDFRLALHQACLERIGSPGWTSADCQEVKDALDATETDKPDKCDLQREPPVCAPGQTTQDILFDDFENGCSGWTASASVGANAWTCPESFYASSGIQHAFGEDLPGVSDSSLAMSSALTLPPWKTYLRFRHAHDFEGRPIRYDGGVVEYSTDAGASWTDAGGLIDVNGYNGTITWGYDNPLAGRSAFTTRSNGYFTSRLDLFSLAGRAVRFRFRVGTDSSLGVLGWAIDDVRFYQCANPEPTTASLSPGSVMEGTGDLTLTVTGSGFTPDSEVLWNGQPRPTTTLGSSQVKATIAASDIAVRGTSTVSVRNRPPGGGTSSPMTFRITPLCPAPAHVYTYSRGTLTADDCEAPHLVGAKADIYQFTGYSGQKIRVKLASTSFVPYMVLRDAAGLELRSFRCGGGGRNACIDLGQMTSMRDFTFFATSATADGRGAYVLRIRRRR